ncbi:hypothetical protein HHK36_012011 [Tetracentron sinense]|uniref:VQ domain-containing protein n=1 Tax=Tetracentron sinense TaxID=13715 RepID=A0A834ZE67_TETSI|nr:hypothetical protein HHK36_012011 [Tetracentron sinense]
MWVRAHCSQSHITALGFLLVSDLGMRPMLGSKDGSYGDDLEEIGLLLRQQRRQEVNDRESELKLYQSSSTPPIVEGSLTSVGGLLDHGGNATLSDFAGSPSALGMHKDSQVISKLKPKIRIIHIFAPEIIKTDVANFRELVQRLTGKPSDPIKGSRKKKRRSVASVESRTLCSKPTETMGLRDGFDHDHSPDQYRERIKEEEERIWGGENSSSFFGGFADLDGFIQELNEYPLLPLNASHMDVFGEA